MNTTPKPIIVQLIDAAWEQDQENGFRPHLGGSMIGEKCERKLVYSFRWAKQPVHAGRLLRLFNRGHLEEFRFVSYLRRIGAEIREYSERLMYHPESDSYITAPWPKGPTKATLVSEDVPSWAPPEELQEDALIPNPELAPEIAGLDDVTEYEHHRSRAEKEFGIKLKQWRILDVNGHFGGSLDGIAIQVPGMPDLDEEVLTEFKTHNDKSFVELVKKGVRECKPTHYAQMQIYMFKKGLKRALYMAVNKNDDDLYCEWIELDPIMGPNLIEKASRVINARSLPNRIARHASWIDCKWCEFKGICHNSEPMLKHCRTCRFSIPVEDGQWHCGKWNAIIPVDAIPKGCDSHEPITD